MSSGIEGSRCTCCRLDATALYEDGAVMVYDDNVHRIGSCREARQFVVSVFIRKDS